jgi:hypothetical protein
LTAHDVVRHQPPPAAQDVGPHRAPGEQAGEAAAEYDGAVCLGPGLQVGARVGAAAPIAG